MPRKYKRKDGVQARIISWTKEQLQSAFNEIDKKKLGINEISRRFGIPSRTLRRRYETKNKMNLTLGKHPVLGFDNERTLVEYILKLRDAGFPIDGRSICKLAYHFAEKLQINHNFDKENQMAGNEWFKSFIERNSDLSVRQAEMLSVSRDRCLRRKNLNKFHEHLVKVLNDNDLRYKPERIYNMDELRIEINNIPESIDSMTSVEEANTVSYLEKNEILTIIACCNAIGNFLPPTVIIKEVKKESKIENRLPPGSKVYVNEVSSNINTNLFYKWFTEQFINLKPQGKVLLILDSHPSHSSAPDMLEMASQNNVVLLCLPHELSPTIQPLDKVFGPFNSFLENETNQFRRRKPNESTSHHNVGTLIGNAWLHAATPKNALNGFKKSGIYPPDYSAWTNSVNISDMT